MSKLGIIRKSKSLFMKWRLHGIVEPFTGAMLNAVIGAANNYLFLAVKIRK